MIIVYVRWHLPVPRVRSHVRHASLSAVLGGCTPSGTESTVLYIPEWRFSDAD